MTVDPELKQTNSGVAVTSFSIAVNRRKNGEVDFINCTAWRQTAEFITKYFRKGSSICVTGAIQNRTWTDQSGQKRYATDIVVDEVAFVDGKNDNQQADGFVPNELPADDMVAMAVDEDLPF